MAEQQKIEKIELKVHLRDYNTDMVKAWKDEEAFGDPKFKNLVELSEGDIFKGGPAADAIVSPANSFGFMDGGIDMAYSLHFGWQMQERLQTLLRESYDGELPVGEAVVIPAYSPETKLAPPNLPPTKNMGQPIKFLISAPTMRVPSNVDKTVNAYLAFRAILRAAKQHNQKKTSNPIRTILCPGLGTAVGRMPYKMCAVQMRTAYEAVMFKNVPAINNPPALSDCCTAHINLLKVGRESGRKFPTERQEGELFVP